METLLKNTFIFAGVKDDDFSCAVSKIAPVIRSFERDEIIFSPQSFNKEIGFVISGKCTVSKNKSAGADVPLNVLKKNDSFGIISVLSDRDEYPTHVVASEPCKILFISRGDVLFLLNNYTEISQNFIKFLTKKIVFLNDKISTFSAYNVEQKLSNYLLQMYRKSDCTTLAFSKTMCAKAINSGRASLYRALDALTEKNIISIKDKKIIIDDLEGLERNSK